MKLYDIHEQSNSNNKTKPASNKKLVCAQRNEKTLEQQPQGRSATSLCWSGSKTWHFNCCWWNGSAESGYYDAAHPPGQIAQQTKTGKWVERINWQRPAPCQLCGIRKGIRAQCKMSSAEQLILGNDDAFYLILQPSASIRIPRLSRHLGLCCLQTREDGGKRKWLFNQ